jgi:hypothetical protein
MVVVGRRARVGGLVARLEQVGAQPGQVLAGLL